MQKNMQKGLAERITAVRDQLGGTKILEERSGISQSYLSRLMRGVIDNPGVNQVMKIAEAGGVSLDYLLTGVASSERVAESIEDLEGGRNLYIDKSVLDRIGLDADQCRVFSYQGDTIDAYKHSDKLLVNVDSPTGDGIYLVDFGNGISVRRLSWMPGSMVNVISDNYGSDQVAAGELNIVGKVVWAGIRQ